MDIPAEDAVRLGYAIMVSSLGGKFRFRGSQVNIGDVDGSHRELLRPSGRRGSRVTANADTQLVSLGGSATRERGGTMFVRIFVFIRWNVWGRRSIV